jgi:hypothetical protein
VGALAETLSILAGYGLVTAAILQSGRALLGRLVSGALPAEQLAISWMLGSAVFSLALFILCALHMIGRMELGALLALAIAAGWRERWQLSRPGAATLVSVVFLATYFIAAMAPSVDSDGYRYHLGFPHLYLARGGFFPIREDFYSAFPQAMEMQFLLGLRFGGFSVANLLHWNAMAALAAGIHAAGTGLGRPAAGAVAAAAAVSASVVGTTAASASVDVALAAAVWISFHCWLRWRETPSDGWLIAAAAGTGLACAIKYTGISAVMVAAVFLLSRPGRVRNCAIGGAVALVLIAPWLVRNWVYFGNPVYPFLNSVFENPYLLPSTEAAWREVVRHYEGVGFDRTYAWEAAIRGVRTAGFAGPFFLFTPLAMLAARCGAGRWMLAAGAMTALPWIFGNPILRFAIPVLAFVALGICLALEEISRAGRALLMLALAAQAAMCFPPFIERWNKQSIAAVKEIPWRRAFRIESPVEYWRQAIPSYRVLAYVEAHTPPDARILAFDGQDQFFTTRLLANFYASEASASAAAMLERAADTTAWPSAGCVADLGGVSATHVRLRQNAQDGSPWTLYEVEVDGAAPESVTAEPNRWEAARAGDGDTITAWSSKQSKHGGMWLEMRWNQARGVERMTAVTSLAYGAMTVACSSDGKRWREAGAVRCAAIAAADVPWRSVRELRKQGWHYVLAGRDYEWLRQAEARPQAWGLEVVYRSGAMRLLKVN